MLSFVKYAPPPWLTHCYCLNEYLNLSILAFVAKKQMLSNPLPLWMSELTPQADNRLQRKDTDHMVWLPNSQGYILCICCLYLPKSGVRWLVFNRLIISTVLQFFIPCSYEEVVPITPCVCYIHIHTTIILRHAARIIKSYSWKLNVKEKNNIDIYCWIHCAKKQK